MRAYLFECDEDVVEVVDVDRRSAEQKMKEHLQRLKRTDLIGSLVYVGMRTISEFLPSRAQA